MPPRQDMAESRDASGEVPTSRPLSPGRSRTVAALVAFGLVLVTTAVFFPVRHHDFVWDDGQYLVLNPSVKKGLTLESLRWSFGTFYAANWHPLTWVSHLLDVRLFGLNPTGHHLVNVAWHAANAALLFLLLFRMTGALWRSALAAALFALHPLRVESVAWVAERKDVLSAFFGLLCLHAYISYLRRAVPGRYFPVVLWFALGLLSKPMLVTLPFTLLLLDGWPLGRSGMPAGRRSGHPWPLGRSGMPAGWRSGLPGRVTERWGAGRLLLEKIPLFLLAGTSAVVTYLAQSRGHAVNIVPFPYRVSNAIVSYVHYLAKTAWPRHLSVFYPHPGQDLSWGTAAGAGGLLLAASLLALLARRSRPYVTMGWFWYLGTLVPVIGLVQVGEQAMADRYTYLPHIGLFIILAWTLGDLAQRTSRGRGIGAIAILILTLLVALTSAQLRHWRDAATLFSHAIRVSPVNALAHYNLGVALKDAGKTDEAMDHFREAILIQGTYVDARTNLGFLLTMAGRSDEAVEQWRLAIQANPSFAPAYNNLAVEMASRGKAAEAESLYRQALNFDPDNVQAHTNLADLLSRQGRTAEALSHFREAARIDPSSSVYQANLGASLAAAGDVPGAIARFEEALRLDPRNAEAHQNLGVALADRERYADAWEHFEEALRLKPDSARTMVNYAEALLRTGQRAEAEGWLREALLLEPVNARAQILLREAFGGRR